MFSLSILIWAVDPSSFPFPLPPVTRIPRLFPTLSHSPAWRLPRAGRTETAFCNGSDRFFMVWHPLTSGLILISIRITSACPRFLCSGFILKTSKQNMVSWKAVFSITHFSVAPHWAGRIAALLCFLCVPWYFVHSAVTACTELYDYFVCVSVSPTRLSFTKTLTYWFLNPQGQAQSPAHGRVSWISSVWSNPVCPGSRKDESKIMCKHRDIFRSKMYVCLIGKVGYYEIS